MDTIDLYKFNELVDEQKDLTKEQADLIRDFIKTKIDNGTLYTPDYMVDYSLIKRFQLFINSNIAEHTIADILGGTVLEGNDVLTLTSTAIIGKDGCALADVNINGDGVEVKVTYDNTTKARVLKNAHKKQVVAIYIISALPHWEFYIRGDACTYASASVIKENSYSLFDETYDQAITDKAIEWQETLRVSVPKLPLLYFKEFDDGSVAITKMLQK